MAVRNKPELESKINELVRTGDYEDADDVIEHAVTLLDDQRKLRNLRSVLREAEEEYAANGGFAESDEFWDQVKSGALARDKRGEPIDSNVVP